MIEGWLHTSTRFAARNLQRNEKNRQRYEREAGTMNSLLREESPAGAWEQLRPMIDDAVHQLDGRDRYAVLLRFFEGRTFAEVGVALGVGEDAARMRVERALAKLQRMLERRGVASTATALGVALANQAALAVPAGLSATVTGMALAGAGAAGASATGAALLNLMSTTKITIGVAVIVALAGVGAAVREASAVRLLRGEWQNADHERSLAGAMNTRLQAKLAEADRDAKSARERIASLEQALQLSKQTSANPPAAHTSTAVNPYTNPEYSRLYLQKYRASLGLKYGACLPEFVAAIDKTDDFCIDKVAGFAYVTRHRGNTIDRYRSPQVTGAKCGTLLAIRLTSDSWDRRAPHGAGAHRTRDALPTSPSTVAGPRRRPTASSATPRCCALKCGWPPSAKLRRTRRRVGNE